MAETLPIVVPVRYSGGGLTMQTTSSRLNAEGVFVRGFVTPKEGSVLSLTLTLPGAPQPVQAKGVITERVMPGDKGKEAGFWARFDSMDEASRTALDALLNDRGGGGNPVKRAFPRVKTRLQVGWASPREFLVAYSENISRGGIFVATAKPPPLRDVVELLLELPDGMVPAKTDAEVIQSLTPDQAARLGRTPGAGLQFVGSSDEFRRRLDLCIENLLNEPA
ncbi:MAG: PilZ domain-containing protein [Myxococcales bacterium]|nr:PilZ domain-containing protein [Myxococcales bacterium]